MRRLWFVPPPQNFGSRTAYDFNNSTIRDVNRAEISGPARKFFCSARPGPESIYYKICTMVLKYYCILSGAYRESDG